MTIRPVCCSTTKRRFGSPGGEAAKIGLLRPVAMRVAEMVPASAAVSETPKPYRMSLPLPPEIVSAPSPPEMVSAVAVPARFSGRNVPLTTPSGTGAGAVGPVVSPV